jgi:aldose 1-epimerase
MKMNLKTQAMVGLSAVTMLLASCSCPQKSCDAVKKEAWGKLSTGEAVDLYTLTSKTGIEMKVSTYGGIITSLKTPDNKGQMTNIVLGFDNLAAYEKGTPYFGALIGRYGNRIGKAQFTLNDSTYKLAANDGANHLHGGLKGFDKVIWTAEPVSCGDAAALKLTYLSKDGEEGYPGNLQATVVYSLKGNDLEISYEATTDKATPVNLTNHAYYNLGGKGDVLGYELTLNAPQYTVVDSVLIPTGEIKAVAGTPFDFTTPHLIGERIDSVKGGYDHNFVLAPATGDSLNFAARVYDKESGRVMEIFTKEPAIQFYSGNFLNGTLSNGSFTFVKHSALCLETQHYPDSPNQPAFPSTILNPGQKYATSTIMRFSTK